MNNFYIETYGCQMNRSDSTSISNTLIENSFTKVSDISLANTVIINTCSVREHAENRVFARVGHFVGIRKRAMPELKIIVTGCMVRTSKDRLLSIGADRLFNVYEQDEILDYMKGHVLDLDSDERFNYNYNFKKSYKDEKKKHSAYIPITHGCDNWCTYCIVPHTRGKMHSRKSSDIIDEVRRLSDMGVREIILLGQNVNSYGIDNSEISFVELLYQIDKEVGENHFIRFLTSHPKDFSKDLADAIYNLRSICLHIHLPLQSGSDRILKLMNRNYTKDEYLRNIKYLRDYDDSFALSTDIIVGFADESDSEFNETLLMLEMIEYEEAFLYGYSERAGSVASKKGIKYDKEKTKDRLSILIEHQHKVADNVLRKSLGKDMRVMFEGSAKDKEHYLCRSYENRRVLVKHDDNFNYKNGDIITVNIYDIKGYSFFGKAI